MKETLNYIQENKERYVEELFELLKIASISADYSIAQFTIANWKRFAHASDQYPVSEILPASIDELIRAHDGVIKYSNDDSLNSLSILLKV